VIAASSSGPSKVSYLDGEGIVIDCSHPNTLISPAFDQGSSEVGGGRADGAQNRATLASGPQGPRPLFLLTPEDLEHIPRDRFTRLSHPAFPSTPFASRKQTYQDCNLRFLFDFITE